MILRLIAIFWAAAALYSSHIGEPRIEFWGCVVMSGLAGIAAEVEKLGR